MCLSKIGSVLLDFDITQMYEPDEHNEITLFCADVKCFAKNKGGGRCVGHRVMITALKAVIIFQSFLA